MRLVPIKSLKVGEMLSSAIRMGDGRMLLQAKSIITANYIERLKNLGIFSVYIEDELFNDVVATPALEDDTKTFALNAVAKVFESIEKGKPINEDEVKQTTKKIYGDVLHVIDEPISIFNTYAIDEPRYLHSVNVATMVAAIAISRGMNTDAIHDYVLGGLLHDIKLKSLSEDLDWKHAVEGYEFLRTHKGLSARTYVSVNMHHEKYDGTGGPKKLAGENINEGARIIAIADMYDNLIYGYAGYKPLLFHQALEYMNMNVGTIIDPQIMKAFNECISIYPTGATVVLSNMRRALVVKQTPFMPSRPRVRLIMPKREDCIELNLMTERTLFIHSVEI